jgi:hypothetical protein
VAFGESQWIGCSEDFPTSITQSLKQSASGEFLWSYYFQKLKQDGIRRKGWGSVNCQSLSVAYEGQLFLTMPLPFSFGDSVANGPFNFHNWSENPYTGVYQNMGGFAGNQTFAADAYGTLILPNAVYDTVLRVHHWYSTQGYSPYGQSAAPYYHDAYYFIKPGIHHPLAQMQRNAGAEYADTSVSGSYLLEYYFDPNQPPQPLFPVDSTALLELEGSFAFPNPSDGNLYVNIQDEVNPTIRVYDALGHHMPVSIQNTSLSNFVKLDLTGFVNGMYLVTLATSTRTVKQKVLIVRPAK